MPKMPQDPKSKPIELLHEKACNQRRSDMSLTTSHDIHSKGRFQFAREWYQEDRCNSDFVGKRCCSRRRENRTKNKTEFEALCCTCTAEEIVRGKMEGEREECDSFPYEASEGKKLTMQAPLGLASKYSGVPVQSSEE